MTLAIQHDILWLQIPTVVMWRITTSNQWSRKWRENSTRLNTKWREM